MRLLFKTFALLAVLPWLAVVVIAMTQSATWSTVAYVGLGTALLAGLVTLPDPARGEGNERKKGKKTRRPRGLSRGALVAIVAVAILRVCVTGDSRTMRLIDGAAGEESRGRFVNRVLDEGDLAIAGTRVLVASGALRDDAVELPGAMRSAYAAMRREEGSPPSPVAATLLGLERPGAFDLVLVEPAGEAPAHHAVVFLHGFAGNWDLPCWQIARAVSSAAVVTACPSTRFVGDWGSADGEATLRRTVDVLRARGIDGIVLAGLSNGGLGASALAPKMKGAFAGLVLISGADPGAPSPGVPTLVIHGEHDSMVHPSTSRAYAKKHGAKYVELDAGHFAMLVRGAAADRAIGDFVAATLVPRASR
ncbi:MAG: alpha/beta hydrolase [Labilithrix sp.]|nr:alpha/beta hydrolase [Labilithrix sp.]